MKGARNGMAKVVRRRLSCSRHLLTNDENGVFRPSSSHLSHLHISDGSLLKICSEAKIGGAGMGARATLR